MEAKLQEGINNLRVIQKAHVYEAKIEEVAEIAFNLGKREGIRELLAYRSEPMMAYHDKYCEVKDVIILVIPQAKLKSWGL